MGSNGGMKWPLTGDWPCWLEMSAPLLHSLTHSDLLSYRKASLQQFAGVQRDGLWNASRHFTATTAASGVRNLDRRHRLEPVDPFSCGRWWPLLVLRRCMLICPPWPAPSYGGATPGCGGSRISVARGVFLLRHALVALVAPVAALSGSGSQRSSMHCRCSC